MEDDERTTAPAPDEPMDVPAPAPTEAIDAPVEAPAEASSADMFPPDDTVMVTDGSDVVVDDTSDVVVHEPASAPPAAAATATGTRPPVKKPALKGRGGTAGIFAGVAIIAPVLIRELALGSEPFLLLPVSMIALAVALSGFRVAQGGRDGTLGRFGLIVAVVGALILTVMFSIMAYNDLVLNTRLQSGAGIIQFGFYALLAGILMFGAATLVAGVITRGPTLLMMVSLVVGLLLDMIGAFPGLRFRWGPEIVLGQGMHYGLKIFGLSLIWLGYSILKDTKAKAAAVVSEA
jgi:hypothetical protein